ncbi:MAG: hypothetical protein IPG79_21735 [Saprospiraceae bacterium]|nr:hypothetical protein [Saprospiraceae bacterium]
MVAVHDNFFISHCGQVFLINFGSDGTSTNTKLVKDLKQTVASIVSIPNNRAVFSLNGGDNVDDVWV